MRVLAIDPALRNTGYAIIERIEGKRSGEYQAITYGVVKNAKKHQKVTIFSGERDSHESL